MIIGSMTKQLSIGGVQVVRLMEECFKQVYQTPFQHFSTGCLTFTFLAMGRTSTAYIIVLVSRTADARPGAVLTKMTVKPFQTFTKQSHIRRMMHLAFVTGGISHTYMLVIQVGTPVFHKYRLKGFNIWFLGKLLTDDTDNLIIGDRIGKINHDAVEKQEVDIGVEVFYQVRSDNPVRISGSSGNLPDGGKTVLSTQGESFEPTSAARDDNGKSEWMCLSLLQ